MRLELLHRLPELSDAELRNLPRPWADYARRLSRGLHEMSKTDIRAVRELDAPPVLSLARITSGQALTANTLTTVQFNSTLIDTHGWFDSTTYTYTPLFPGFYRCSWSVNFHDTVAIAASTYAYAQLNTARFAIAYGNGTALDTNSGGSSIVECNGSTDTILLKALILTGTAPTVFAAASPYRTWLDVQYIGRRLVT